MRGPVNLNLLPLTADAGPCRFRGMDGHDAIDFVLLVLLGVFGALLLLGWAVAVWDQCRITEPWWYCLWIVL